MAAGDGLYLDLDGEMSGVGQDRSILEQGNIRRSDDVTTAGDSDNDVCTGDGSIAGRRVEAVEMRLKPL